MIVVDCLVILCETELRAFCVVTRNPQIKHILGHQFVIISMTRIITVCALIVTALLDHKYVAAFAPNSVTLRSTSALKMSANEEVVMNKYSR